MMNNKLSIIEKVLLSSGLLASILTLGSLLGQLHWMLDALSHFHIQYTGLLLIAAPALLLMRERRLRGLIPIVPALLVNLYLLAPFFIADEQANGTTETITTSNSPPLRVLSMNISTSTAGYPQVIELIRQREPDIIFLSEVREDLVLLLQRELGELYPVLHAEPSRQTLGLAILSRHPMVHVQTVSADADMGRMRRRYLRADLTWNGTPVTLVGIHPLPPIRGEWAYGRDREIGVMGVLAQQTEHPFILVGDLNASPWSYAMRTLTTETKLRYATVGYGIWPTWFVGQSLVGPLLGSPLDHILLSPEWQVIDYTESGDIGSDHAPVQADLLLQ